ncbi:MAG: hypothetical protein IPK82_42245 [Polyangiaceae bacterium]|nr:hypothetical protein [Polyangiaceae bacterium]
MALRWGAFQLDWWPLREAVVGALRFTLEPSGLVSVHPDPVKFWVGHESVHITVSCTHVEVFALLCPLLWDWSVTPLVNLKRYFALAAGLAVFALVRLHVAVWLLSRGVSWVIGHDVLLGVSYFVLMASALKYGAWTKHSTH